MRYNLPVVGTVDVRICPVPWQELFNLFEEVDVSITDFKEAARPNTGKPYVLLARFWESSRFMGSPENLTDAFIGFKERYPEYRFLTTYELMLFQKKFPKPMFDIPVVNHKFGIGSPEIRTDFVGNPLRRKISFTRIQKFLRTNCQVMFATTPYLHPYALRQMGASLFAHQ